MTVLEGEVTHRNRSGASSSAIGPAAASPPTIASIDARCARTASRSSSAASARRAVTWRSPSATRTPRKRFVRQNSTTPTLTSSPRSTRGDTRRTAYSNGSRGTTKLLDRVDERGARRHPGQQVAHVRRPLFDRSADPRNRLQPGVRRERDDALEEIAGDERRQSRMRDRKGV